MKLSFTYLSLVVLFLIFGGCTKETEFLEKPTFVQIYLNSTSNNFYEFWLDGIMLKDSVNQQKPFGKVIEVGEHKIGIKPSKEKDFIIDTILNLNWTPKPKQFTLLDLGANQKPMFFTGFPSELPEAKEGFVTFAIINLDLTRTKGKTIDIQFFDITDPSKKLFEIKGIQHNAISEYYTVTVDEFNMAGLIVIRDSFSQEILINGITEYIVGSLGYYYPGASNTYLISFSNLGNAEVPYYTFSNLFEGIR